MECDEKEFGCLCKNVGGHFPCLFHGLNVKEKELLQFLQKYLLLYFQDVVGLLYRLVPSKTVTTTLTNEVFKQKSQ